jgi:hypothetical protein
MSIELTQSLPADATPDQLAALRDYAAGHLGTRQAMERAGVRDYAELIIALVQHDLHLPRPADTPRRQAHLALARAILQPRLRHGDKGCNYLLFPTRKFRCYF